MLPGMSVPRFSFENARILVTGGSRGIGFALAEALAKKKAKVALLARHATDVEAARAKLADPNSHRAIVADVTDSSSLARAMESVRRDFGALDAVVANAAILAAGPFVTTTPDATRRVLETNVLGVLETVRLALPLLDASERRPRRIVVVGSFAGRRGVPGLALYSASKGALVAFCDALRAEIEVDVPPTTTVSLVSPGPTRTSFFVSPFARERSFEPRPTFEPETSAALLLRALERGEAHLEATKSFRLKQLLATLWPRRDDARLRLRLR